MKLPSAEGKWASRYLNQSASILGLLHVTASLSLSANMIIDIIAGAGQQRRVSGPAMPGSTAAEVLASCSTSCAQSQNRYFRVTPQRAAAYVQPLFIVAPEGSNALGA